MIDFTPQSELDDEYVVYGCFYDVDLGNGHVEAMRNVLDIYSANMAPHENHFNTFDALFILLNPGSATPINTDDVIPTFEWETFIESLPTLQMVPTTPDPAQYQLMRIMKFKGWNHVRVLNLSDIRDGNSTRFRAKVKSFEQLTDCDTHSVFSERRMLEREQFMGDSFEVPIIAAWGVNTQDIRLATKCSSAVGHRDIRGIPANLFYHASPQKQSDKERWLQGMIDIL